MQKWTLAIKLRLRNALVMHWSCSQMLISTGHMPLSPSMDLTILYRNRWPKEGIYDTITFSNTAARVHAREGFQTVLQHKIYNTLHNTGYSGMLQIMGFASAIGCDVKVVNPDKRHSLLPLLTATYRPRVGDLQQSQFTFITIIITIIMMTTASGWTDRSKEFQVNHFVSMVKVDTSTTNKLTRVKCKRHSMRGTIQKHTSNKKSLFIFRQMKGNIIRLL